MLGSTWKLWGYWIKSRRAWKRISWILQTRWHKARWSYDRCHIWSIWISIRVRWTRLRIFWRISWILQSCWLKDVWIQLMISWIGVGHRLKRLTLVGTFHSKPCFFEECTKAIRLSLVVFCCQKKTSHWYYIDFLCVKTHTQKMPQQNYFTERN